MIREREMKRRNNKGCPLQNLGKIIEFLRATSTTAKDMQRTAKVHPCKTSGKDIEISKDTLINWRNLSKSTGAPLKTTANPLEPRGVPVHNLRRFIDTLRGTPAIE
jgi:hypothetical protein